MYPKKDDNCAVWVPFEERKPRISGYYFWRGKTNTGGRNYYDSVTQEFDFNFQEVGANKVSDSNLLWLEENSVRYTE